MLAKVLEKNYLWLNQIIEYINDEEILKEVLERNEVFKTLDEKATDIIVTMDN